MDLSSREASGGIQQMNGKFCVSNPRFGGILEMAAKHPKLEVLTTLYCEEGMRGDTVGDMQWVPTVVPCTLHRCL